MLNGSENQNITLLFLNVNIFNTTYREYYFILKIDPRLATISPRHVRGGVTSDDDTRFLLLEGGNPHKRHRCESNGRLDWEVYPVATVGPKPRETRTQPITLFTLETPR